MIMKVLTFPEFKTPFLSNSFAILFQIGQISREFCLLRCCWHLLVIFILIVCPTVINSSNPICPSLSMSRAAKTFLACAFPSPSVQPWAMRITTRYMFFDQLSVNLLRGEATHLNGVHQAEDLDHFVRSDFSRTVLVVHPECPPMQTIVSMNEAAFISRICNSFVRSPDQVQ